MLIRFVTHAFMFYLISSCCLRRLKRRTARKIGHSGWKIKWFVSFYLGSFREDLRRSNFCTLFSLFRRFGYNFLRLVLKFYSPFSPRPHPNPLPPPPNQIFHYHCFQFFSPFNTVAPREIENNDHGRTFWGINKILYAVGKIVNSFIYIYAQDFHPAAGGLCEW